MSSAVSRSASSPRANRLSRAPSRARRCAIALPIPRPAPVTTTCLPSTGRRLAGRLAHVEHLNLGATGLKVSRVCLGMMSYGRDESRPWALDETDAAPIVRRAVEGGITFFDTADVYNGGQSEIVTG